ETGALLKNYRVLSIPQHFLIGKDGRIEEVKIGVLSAQQILELIK
ncbi:sporulation protein, partial [candidate division WWE3 bacterium CG10_big_fil_rev_8_21_14_0_10_48_23]